MKPRVFKSSAAPLALLFALTLSPCRAPSGGQEGLGARPSPSARSFDSTPEGLRRLIETVRPLHRPLGAVQPGDWLTHTEEPGQTFEEYLGGDPVRPDEARRVLYVQPLGPFTPAQRRVVRLTADFMSLFFNLPVTVRPDLRLRVPRDARRRHPQWGNEQIQSGYLSMQVLRPALPSDAVALIGFTATDLYPDEHFNYVFGQASLVDRVGVWSLYRLGDPGAGDEGFRLTLLRTLKIATHETGHMFSIRHCTKYECVMCGTNHLAETDRRPLDACPECTAKICWATRADPRERYARLAAFCAAQGLAGEQKAYEAAVAALAKT